MALGGLLLAAAVGVAVYNVWDENRAQAASQQVLTQWQEKAVQPTEPAEEETAPSEMPDYLLFPDMEMPTVEIEGNLYIGKLEIPAIDLVLPVMSQWSYAKLKIAPCRYQGSAYSGDLIIAGHSYNCHFSGLGSLLPGDLVYFTDADGNCFTYQVVELEEIQPEDIDGMCGGDWDLTLFTCVYGGQSRLTVRCESLNRYESRR